MPTTDTDPLPQDAYQQGWDAGYQVGWDDCLQSIPPTDDDPQDAYQQGWDSGYNAGYDDGSEDVWNSEHADDEDEDGDT